MTLHILSKQDTVLNKFIAQIRDKSVQKDSMRFRRNLERIGEIIISGVKVVHAADKAERHRHRLLRQDDAKPWSKE